MTWNPCCCLNLRTGVLLIGILEIISWSIALKDSCIGLIFTISMSNFAQQLQNTTEIEYSGADTIIQTAYIISGISLAACVVRVIIACILVLGVQRNSIRMIGAWIFVKAVTLFLAVGTFVASLFFVQATNFSGYPGASYVTGTAGSASSGAQGAFGLVIFYALNIGFSVYFIWVAYSLLKELRAQAAESEAQKEKEAGKGILVHKF